MIKKDGRNVKHKINKMMYHSKLIFTFKQFKHNPDKIFYKKDFMSAYSINITTHLFVLEKLGLIKKFKPYKNRGTNTFGWRLIKHE